MLTVQMMCNKDNKRVMAIDYGDTRTGVAVSDISGSITGEAWVITTSRQEDAAKAIAEAAAEREVGKIVVGYPKNMNGTIGSRAEKSGILADMLRGIAEIEVILWDERLTTVSAHKILDNVGKYGKKRKKTVDALAASLILDSYLRSV